MLRPLYKRSSREDFVNLGVKSKCCVRVKPKGNIPGALIKRMLCALMTGLI